MWQDQKKMCLTGGPRSINRNLVGTGTSVRSPRRIASLKRINADNGFSSSFSSPTRMFEASASFGIFFMKCCKHTKKKCCTWMGGSILTECATERIPKRRSIYASTSTKLYSLESIINQIILLGTLKTLHVLYKESSQQKKILQQLNGAKNTQ